MIHSSRVITRIAELIKLAGISTDAEIEEMTDHYLSEIEYLVKQGSSEQKAIRNTYQSIALSDLRTIDQKQTKQKQWVIGILSLAVMILFLISQCNQNHSHEVQIANYDKLEIPNGWPIDNSIDHVISSYGLKTHPISNTRKFHKGIDIKAPLGTSILSTGDGKVTDSGYNLSSGYYIVISHNKQYSTQYLHLSKLDVINNQKVEKGNHIGLVGNSGISLIPHLHYEVIKNEHVVDPMDVIAP